MVTLGSMNKKLFLCSVFFFTSFALFAKTQSASSSSESSSEAISSANGISVEEAVKPKRRIRVKSNNFKGTDPMVAPDGQSQLPPTDGSRPKSK